MCVCVCLGRKKFDLKKKKKVSSQYIIVVFFFAFFFKQDKIKLYFEANI